MEPQITKLLSGGINLLPAADAIPEGQAIAAQNWRTDQTGILRSRKSNTAAVASPGGYVHSIVTLNRISSKIRYYGADDKLYRDSALVASGFDGTPLGTVSFQDRMWVMNRSKQVKDDGTNLFNWTPTPSYDPPTDTPAATEPAPTYVAGGAATGGLLGPITYYVTGVVPGVGEVCVSAPLTTTSDNAAAALPWGQLVPFFPGFPGTPASSPWAGWSDNESAVITPPTFAYPEVTQYNVYRVTPYMGFANTIMTPSIDWFIPVQTQQLPYLLNAEPIDIGDAYTDLGLDLRYARNDNPILSGAFLNVATAYDYTYYVTGVTDLGEETNPSPPLLLSLTAGSVTITRPDFVDPQITGWNVYRGGGPSKLQPYRINVEIIPIETDTYVDTRLDNTPSGGTDQSDQGIADIGIAMATDHNDAPPARGLAGPFCQKLLAFSTEAHPARIFWTPSDEPSYFPGADSEQDGNWADIGEDGEAVVAIAVFPQYVVVLKEKSYWRMNGDPDSWGADIERTNVEIGQLGAKAFTIAGPIVFGQATEGISAFNGALAQKMSGQLDPIFKGDGVNTVAAIPSLPVHPDPAVRARSCMAYRNGRLYFSYRDSEGA